MSGHERINPQIKSAMLSLKELLTIVSGLAATNSVLQLMETTKLGGEYSLGRLEWSAGLLCFVNVLTIARFYHGNYRHLDEEYSGREGKGYTHPTLLSGSARVASDFVVVLIQALLLTFSSFLFPQPLQYIFLIAGLLILDAIWFFFAHTTRREAQGARLHVDSSEDKGRAWALNNIFFGITFIVLSTTVEAESQAAIFFLILIFTVLAIINAGIDIFNQFGFYFPSVERNARVVFLAAPLTAKVQDGIWTDTSLRELITAIQDDLIDAGFKVINAHTKEEWGEEKRTPTHALREDLSDLRDSSVLVAIIEPVPSPGVQIQLGAAAILNKTVVQVSHANTTIPYLNEGFPDVLNRARHVRYRDTADCVSRVRSQVIEAIPTITFGSRRIFARRGSRKDKTSAS